MEFLYRILYSKYGTKDLCFLVYDKKGNIKYINGNTLNMFKYPKGIKPKKVFDLMENCYIEEHKPRLVNNHGMYNKNIRGLCYNKDIIYLDINHVSKNILIFKISLVKPLLDYKNFFKTIQIGTLITTGDNIIVDTNKSFSELVDKSIETLIGTNLDFLIDTAKFKDKKDVIQKVNDNILLWKLITDHEQKYYTLEDITIQNTYNDSLVRKDEFLEELEILTDTGYWEWCITTNELVWSEGLKKIYEIENVSYENYMRCNHPDYVESMQNTINKCLEDKQKYTLEHKLIKDKSKNEVWLRATGKIVIRDGKEYLIGVAQDISNQKEIEMRYIKQKEIVEKSLSIKSSFISSVSHELRTPLNGIIGMISLLKITDTTEEKKKKYIEILDTSCGVLLSIINNILDFSRIESGRITVEYTDFNIKTASQSVFELFKPSVLTKGIEFNIEFDIETEHIVSDYIKIKQIITNLLSNSIKFTKKGSINLKIHTKNNELFIIVEDTGVGISKNFLKDVSVPFTQQDNSTTRIYGGSGLGLSIITSYIKLLKGTIKIESEVDVGTKVSIILPITLYDTDKSIVIVEDNYINRILLKESISLISECLVECYENGEEAINSIKDEPLIILMDLHMPILDGHSTTIELRKRGYLCPIIAISANGMKSERIKCIESGFDDFILKPVTKSSIENLLQKYKLKD